MAELNPSIGDVFEVEGQWYVRVEKGGKKITREVADQIRARKAKEQRPRTTGSPELKNTQVAGQYAQRLTSYAQTSESTRSPRANPRSSEPAPVSPDQYATVTDMGRPSGQISKRSGDARAHRQELPSLSTEEALPLAMSRAVIAEPPDAERARKSTMDFQRQRTSQSDVSTVRTPEIDEEEMPAEQKRFTVLKGVSIYFALISEQDHAQRGVFLVENPELLNFNLAHFYQEAVSQIRCGDYTLARQCVACLVTIRLCENLKDNLRRSEKIEARVNTLYDPRTERYKEYREKFAAVEEDIRAVAAKPESQSKSSKQSGRPDSRGQATGDSGQNRPRTTNNARASFPKNLGTDTGHEARQRKAAVSSRTEREISRSSQQLEDDILENISELIGKAPDPIKIATEDFEVSDTQRLSSQYRVREHASTFFIPGRVFSILWHEPAGQTGKVSKTLYELAKPDDGYMKARLNRNTTVGVMGQAIYSHIRRMVVIKSRSAYCWCVSIGTYGGQGLKKPGLKQRDRDSHTVIYDSSSQPEYLPNEPETSKKPIAVKLRPGQTLSSASRLNYSKPSTVEFNTPVLDVGMVIKEHLLTLMSDVRNELLDDPPP